MNKQENQIKMTHSIKFIQSLNTDQKKELRFLIDCVEQISSEKVSGLLAAFKRELGK